MSDSQQAQIRKSTMSDSQQAQISKKYNVRFTTRTDQKKVQCQIHNKHRLIKSTMSDSQAQISKKYNVKFTTSTDQ